jgi:hypothetical protein
MADPSGEVEFCELWPDVETSRVVSVTVCRVMMDGDREVPFVLPYKWPAHVSAEMVGEAAGGGVYRAQPRGPRGAFLKGVPPATFLVDGPPRDFVAPGAMPAVAGAPEAPSVPLDAATTVGASPGSSSAAGPLSAIAVPVAAPLAGMPSAMIDLHALPPETRALVGAMYHLQSYTNASIERRSQAEGDARVAVTNIALKSMEELSKATGAITTTTVAALQKELESERGRRSELETRNRDLLSDREADRVELATLRLRVALNLGPESARVPASGPRGILDVLQAFLMEAVQKLGVPIVANALGMDAAKLSLLAANGGAPPASS